MEPKEKVPKNGTESVIRNSRLANVLLFVLCLVGAFAIWIYAMQNDATDYEETFSSVKVELINTSALESGLGLSIFSGFDNVIAVTVVGPRSEVSALAEDKITATADVSAITEAGTFSINIAVKVEGSVSIKSLSKNSITVYADENDTKIVKIEAKYSSVTVPTSYELGELVLDRDTVTVTGPKSALADIDHALVSIDAGYVTTSVTSIGPLSLISESGKQVSNPYIKMSISEVTARIPVYTYKELPLTVDYRYGYFGDGEVTVEISPATVRVKGDPELLSRYEFLLLTTLDEKKISEDITSSIRIELPEGMTLEGEEANATVSVVFHRNYQRIISVTNIVVTGASSAYSVLDTSVSVTLRGTVERLYMLDPAAVSVSVNLNDYGADVSGAITVPATVRLPDYVTGSVYELGEYSVRIFLN